MKGNRFYTLGEYLERNPDWHDHDSEWKAQLIHKILLRNNIGVKEIADLGCGAGGTLAELSKLNPDVEKLIGYDISTQAIALAKDKSNNRLSFLLCDYLSEENVPPAELVLVIDVIEHIQDFYDFLEKVRKKGKTFVFHIPLDLCCRTIFKPHVLKQQRDDVGHIHYFYKELVWWALHDTGYQIIDWEYSFPEVDRAKPNSFKSFIKKWLRWFSFQVAPDISVRLWGGYSMLILAR